MTANTTVDNPKISPKILPTPLLMKKNRTIPIIAIRSQNFNIYPFWPCFAFVFLPSGSGVDAIDSINPFISLCDIKKLMFETMPPASTDQPNATDTNKTDPNVSPASTTQHMRWISCRDITSSVTQPPSPSYPAFYPSSYCAREFQIEICKRQQYQTPTL